MKRLYTLLILLCLILVLGTWSTYGPVSASGGEVAAETAPVPDQPISRKLFNDSDLAGNLIAAGEWVQANDPCAVYGVDYDPGQSNQVELFYLAECFGEAEGER